MNCGNVKEQSESGTTTNEETVCWEVDFGCNGECIKTEHVKDEGFYGLSFGDAKKGILEILGVEANVL